jgi:alpha-L-fucosidase
LAFEVDVGGHAAVLVVGPAFGVVGLVNAVSKEGNLCLNIAPDPRGRLDDTTVSTLRAVGQWLDRNGASIRSCGRSGLEKPEWGRWTLSSDHRHLYAHLLEPSIGHISLKGLRGWVANPLVLSTGNPAILSAYWNPGVQTFDQLDDVFLNFKSPVHSTWPLPDPIDTVVRFDVIASQSERDRTVVRMQDEFRAALREVPFD